uniref:hypothetical protein n=1 Tax=Kiloniella litopenaei TaxID=1549748 RepID=UPI001FE00E59|nr:hypothetical protein [Kiloniella litopenaei]
MPPLIGAGFAVDGDSSLREYSGGIEKCAMMFPAIKTVTDPDPIGPSRRHKPDLATEASPGEEFRFCELLHAEAPVVQADSCVRPNIADIVPAQYASIPDNDDRGNSSLVSILEALFSGYG